MSKREKIYIGFLVFVILLIVIVEYTKPKPINWFPSYAQHHKIPYGTYVFKEQLNRIFSKSNVLDLERPPFELLNQNENLNGTYLFVNNDVSFGDDEIDELLQWTSKGNTLFIASSGFEDKLLDTLHLKTSVISNFSNIDNKYKLQLKSTYLNNDTSYLFDRANFMYYFSEIDTSHTSIISTIDHTNKDSIQHRYANTIKQSFGDGNIVLSTFPQAFTNYFILKVPNQQFTSGLISYIDRDQPVLFDNHYKSGKKFYTSVLYIMLNTPELKWAYYTMLIGVLVYVIFEGRRKQRAIPIIKPLRNQTIDFTRTIANMYYEKSKHTTLAKHKIQHFFNYIRIKHHLRTTDVNDEFIRNLALRSNNTIEDTKHLFKFIDSISEKSNLNDIELEHLNTLIEQFKSNNTWKTKT